MKTKSDVKKINKTVVAITSIMGLGMVADSIWATFDGMFTPLVGIINVLPIVIPIIINFILYKKDNYSKYIKDVTMWMAMGVTLSQSITSGNDLVFTCVLTFMLASIVYLDELFVQKMTVIGTVVQIIIVFINVAFMKKEFVPQTLTSIMVVFSFGMIASAITKMCSDLNSSKNIDINAKQLKQLGTLEYLKESARKLYGDTKNVYEVTDIFIDSSGLIADSVKQIAQGIVSTSNDIQKQANLTNDIQNIIEETCSISEELNATSQESRTVVTSGMDIVKVLSGKTDMVDKRNDEVFEVLTELKMLAEDVIKIVQMITSIADQTNLLSLNAAVEAARFGERGAGFGVLAKEIRSLSDKSKQNAEEIRKILKGLQKKTNDTVEAVIQLKNVSKEQNDSFNEMEKIFEAVNNKMLILDDGISNVTGKISNIVIANNEINEKINDIAGMTETMLASVEEIDASCDDNSKQAEKSKEMLDNLIQMADEFNKYE